MTPADEPPSLHPAQSTLAVERETLEAAAASLRVDLSAAGWNYLRHCRYSLAESIRHVPWRVGTALGKHKALNRPRPANHRASARED